MLRDIRLFVFISQPATTQLIEEKVKTTNPHPETAVLLATMIAATMPVTVANQRSGRPQAAS